MSPTDGAGEGLHVIVADDDAGRVSRLVQSLEDDRRVGSIDVARTSSELLHVMAAAAGHRPPGTASPPTVALFLNPRLPAFDGPTTVGAVRCLGGRPSVVVVADAEDDRLVSAVGRFLHWSFRPSDVWSLLNDAITYRDLPAEITSEEAGGDRQSSSGSSRVVFVETTARDGVRVRYADGATVTTDGDAHELYRWVRRGFKAINGRQVANPERIVDARPGRAGGYVGVFGADLATVDLEISARCRELWNGELERLPALRRRFEARNKRVAQRARLVQDQEAARALLLSFRPGSSKLRPPAHLHPEVGEVFVCHASEDKPTVVRIVEALSRAGVACWFDESSLKVGDDFDLEIRRALRRCRCVVVCLSRTSVSRSGYVQKELRRALDVAEEQPEGVAFILPVRLDECEVPDSLRRWHRFDAFRLDGYEDLAAEIAHRVRSREVR